MKAKSPAPEIVLRGGKPVAVILDIDDYQQMLERLEDAEDLKVLKAMRRKPLKFKSLDKFLEEYSPYDVLLAHQVERDLKRLSADLFHRVIPEIRALANDPRPPGSRKTRRLQARLPHSGLSSCLRDQ